MRESTKEIDVNRLNSSGEARNARRVETGRIADILRNSRRCLEWIEDELTGMETPDPGSSNRPGTGDGTLRRIKRLHRAKKATIEAIETLESRDLPPLATPSSEPCFESVPDYGVVGSSEPSPEAHPDILKDRSPFEETADEALGSSDLPGSSPNPRMN